MHKGQYVLLFGIIIAIFMITYLLNISSFIPQNTKDCLNATLMSIAAHNIYANCTTLKLLLSNRINNFAFLYCEKYNFTHIRCTLQNCSSLLISATVNNQTLTTSHDYGIKYIPWYNTCNVSLNFNSIEKRKKIYCDQPVFIYAFKKQGLIYIS